MKPFSFIMLSRFVKLITVTPPNYVVEVNNQAGELLTSTLNTRDVHNRREI